MKCFIVHTVIINTLKNNNNSSYDIIILILFEDKITRGEKGGGSPTQKKIYEDTEPYLITV